MSTEPTVHVVAGNDAMNKMIDIFLNGFVSGAASGVATILQSFAPSLPNIDEMADTVSDSLVAAIRTDPLAIEELRREIAEELLGTDSGPKSFTLPLPDGEADQ